MSFALFLLLNVALLLPPAALLPGLPIPIYRLLILACCATAIPALLKQLSLRSLREQPITLCVVGLVPIVLLSHLCHGRLGDAGVTGVEFVKLVVFYLLLVATLDSPARLRQYLAWLAAMVAVHVGLALLDFYRLIDVQGIATLLQVETDSRTGVPYVLPRLCGAGFLANPNGLAVVLVLAALVCVCGLDDRHWGRLRWLWIAPLLLFVHSLVLTSSRGGFLALLAGALVFLFARFGRRQALAAAAVGLPALFLAFAGRQTELLQALEHGTGRSRVQFWDKALALFAQSPLFGIGQGMYQQETGRAVHNTFVECFTQLGFFGGTLFLGAFVLALWMLHRQDPSPVQADKAERLPLRPGLMAIVAAYATSMLASSESNTVPTYLVLGLVTAYLRVATPSSPMPSLHVNGALVRRLALTSIGFLAITYVFVRVVAK